jgi:hypothetical protein
VAHEDLIEALRRMPGVLAEFLREVPEEELHRRRGEEIWTLYQHLEHLVTVQDVLHRRLQLIRDQEYPEIAPYSPEENETASAGGAAAGASGAPAAGGSERAGGRGGSPRLGVEALLALYTRRRARQLEIIEAAGADLWAKQAQHPEYERYGFAILVRHILFHDGFHLARMEDVQLARAEYLTSL